MATALPTNLDLECSICLENCKTLKILSCGHSLCRDCLVKHIDGTKWTFPCPLCKQDVEIQRGDLNKLFTIFIQTSTDSQRTSDILTTQPSTSLQPKHLCPNHSKKEVEYYCQTCNLGLCFKCIFNDHNDHKTLDLELDSSRKQIVQELSKYEQFLKNKIEDLEKAHAALLETSEKLKIVFDEACTKISEKTEKIIGELRINCQKRQKEIRDNFNKNESKLTETRQRVITQIKNIKTDLDESRPTTEKPTLTLIYSLNKLQDLQKLYENIKTDIPQVTYVEWREGSVKVCDILGSTVTKALNQSSEGSGPKSTVTKPLYQSSEGSGPISTVTKPLYQSSEGSGTISTVTKPLYQSSEGSGPISTVTKPLHQSSESSGPISTVTKPLYQSSEGSGPISTVTEPLYQSSEGSGPISTVTKPLFQSSEGSGPISTDTKPLYQSNEGSGPIVTVTKPQYQSNESNVFRFNYKGIERYNEYYYSKDNYTNHGMVWSCKVLRNSYNRCLYICIKLLREADPQVKCCTIKYTVTILNKDKDKNVISRTKTSICSPGLSMGSDLEIKWSKLTDPTKGFIDNRDHFLVRFDILQVLDVKYI